MSLAQSRKLAFCLIIASLMAGGCALSPKTKIVAQDIPVTTGTTFAAYQNSGLEATRTVSFDVKGPWDFTQRSGDAIFRSRLVKVSQAPANGQFPEADYAEEVFPSVQSGDVPLFNFISRSASALSVYGQSSVDSDGTPTFKRYTNPERLLVFPAAVGSSWTDTIASKDTPARKYTVARTVVARGEVLTPAGAFFDCLMVRVVREPVAAGKQTERTVMYVWWAPGIGPVAAVGSQAGETKTLFTQAAYIWRLQSYNIKK